MLNQNFLKAAKIFDEHGTAAFVMKECRTETDLPEEIWKWEIRYHFENCSF